MRDYTDDNKKKARKEYAKDLYNHRWYLLNFSPKAARAKSFTYKLVQDEFKALVEEFDIPLELEEFKQWIKEHPEFLLPLPSGRFYQLKDRVVESDLISCVNIALEGKRKDEYLKK